ncbi:MAG: methyl-accepting chemotaxis protein [Negativicutes bacterium]|nr:methyl-accepting chemotaxis protein [Negativicutes bacterium]
MRFSIGSQILVICLLIVACFSGANAYTYWQLKNIEAGYDGIIRRSAPLVFEVKDVAIELRNQSSLVRGYILTANPAYLHAYDNSRQQMAGYLASLEKKLITPEGKEKVAGLRQALKEYHDIADQAIVIRKEKGMDEAVRFVASAGAKIEAADKVTNDFVKFLTERMELRSKQNEEAVASIEYIILVISIIMFILSAGAAVYLARRISRPLAQVARAAESIAGGDLRQQTIHYAGNDEIGDLAKAVNTMVVSLRDVVSRMAKASEHVAASSEELTASAEQSAQAAGQVAETVTAVAAGAASQLNAVDQAVAVVREMAAAISHIATSAGGVSGKSGDTARAATAGGQAVAEATGQMQVINDAVNQSAQVVKRLGESSKQIGEIVNVISGIAGQTNLLALNAAIEAARAGEQGRGFAVVAEEVRKLAEQSQEAAQKIADIIAEIQHETGTAVAAMDKGTDEVTKGTMIIAATGERFQNIVGLVQALDTQIQEISAATEELLASSDEVVHSVEAVKTIAGETAGNTETISAAAEEQSASMQEIASSSQALSKMAEDLQAAVAKFNV